MKSLARRDGGRNRLYDRSLLADRSVERKDNSGMTPACSGEQLGQIFPDVTARSEKHGDDADVVGAILDQGGDRLVERGRHQFEIGQLDAGVGFLGERSGKLLERARPLWIARAVREEDDALLQ